MSQGTWHTDEACWPGRVAEAVRARVFRRFRARGIPPGEATQLAGEVTQIAFVRAHLQPGFPGCFQSEEHLVNWMAWVAYRRGLDDLRRRRPSRSDAHLDRQAAPEVSQVPGLVWECLQQLPPQDRHVLLRYFYEGWTDVMIGQELFDDDASEAAWGQRARKIRMAALRRLRTLLDQHGVDPDDWPAA